MSNHDAGHMVSGIAKKILERFNEGKISQEIAKDLMDTTISAALNYDGNDYECVEQIQGSYCGRCFKAQDKLYDFMNVIMHHYPNELPLNGKEEDIYWDDTYHTFDGFCKECMDEWLDIKFPEIPKEEYYKLME